MKSILLSMAWIFFTLAAVSGQTLTADIHIRYPDARINDLDRIVFQQTESNSQQAGFYTVNKTDWQKGDVFQVTMETPQQDFYAYFMSIDEDGLLRHYAPSSGETGLAPSRIGNKIALPAVHNGFAFHEEATLKAVLLVSSTPLNEINQTLLKFDTTAGDLSEKVQSLWGDQLIATDLIKYKRKGIGFETATAGIVPIYLNFTTAAYQQPIKQSKLHVLSIGPSFADLQYTAKDAEEVADAFKQWEGVYYEQVNIETLTGEKATTVNILQTLSAFRSKYLLEGASANDKVVVFYSTHGLMIDEEMFLQGSDFDQLNPRKTAISYTDIYAHLRDFPGDKIILMDAAAAPAVATYAPRVIEENEPIQPLASERFYPIFSNRSGERSYENKIWENGAFTEALLELLRIQPDNANTATLTMTAFLDYLGTRTAKLVKETLGKEQHPLITRPQYLDFDWLNFE